MRITQNRVYTNCKNSFLKKFLSVFVVFLFLCLPVSGALAVEEIFDFGYDGNGNLVGDDGFVYVYDSFNKLVSIETTQGNSISEFFYDSVGARVKKITSDETTFYFGDFVRVVNSSGVFDFVYINDNSGLLAELGDDSKFYLVDHLGSVDVVVDDSGILVSDFEYLPFGKNIAGNNSRFTFTGQEFDAESDLMFYNARYYSPFMRKFTQPDSVIPNVYDPQSLNRYSYVQNNPVNRVDPSGHIAVSALIVIGIVLFKVVDWGWTAYDAYRDTKTLNDPAASDLDKKVAGFSLGLGVVMEVAEPDEFLPVSLPLDDIGRKIATKKFKKELIQNADEIKKIPIEKLYGHKTDDFFNIFRKGAKSHVDTPIDVIQIGDKYIINDGVGRSARAAAKGDKFVYGKITDFYSSIDDFKILNNVGDSNFWVKAFRNDKKIVDNGRWLKLLFGN